MTSNSQLDVPSLPGNLALRRELAVFEASLGMDTGDVAAVEAEAPVVDGYQLRGSIGEGGMGRVYLAWDEILEREVALKFINWDKHSDPEFEGRLVREAQALARFDHANVVTVHSVEWTADGQPFVVMSYVRGLDLQRWVGQHEPNLTQLLELCAAAGRGLAAVHAEGLVHRDFKPTNVFVADQPDGPHVVVGDFGLAKALAPSEVEPDTIEDADMGERTETGSRVAGTYGYRAPELLCGEPASPASDQYAYCVSVWRLVTQHMPRPGRSLERPKQMPEWLYDVLVRGLSTEPSQRFPDMASLLTELAPPAKDPALWAGTRKWLVLGLGLALSFAAASVGGQMGTATLGHTDRCTAAGALSELWPDSKRAEVAAHLRDLAPPAEAEPLVDAVLTALDGAAARWSEAQRRSCQREWLLGRAQGHCDELWRQRFDRHVELLTQAEASDLVHVPELLRSLAKPGCNELDVPLDHDVARLLDHSRDAVTLADFETGHKLAEQALELGGSIASCGEHWSHERAAAQFQLGYVNAKWGHPRKALDALAAAELEAMACADFALLQRIHLRAAKVQAVHLQDAEAAEQELALADAIANRVDEVSLEDRFETEVSRAAVANLAGDYERAQQHYAAALELIKGHDSLREAEAGFNLGVMAMSRGDAEVAELYWTRAMAELERQLGPSYADRARDKRALVAANIGTLAIERDELDFARVQFELAAASERYRTKLVGFNGLLRVAIAKAYADKRYAQDLELAERAEHELAEHDLPPERLAEHLFLRGRLRLLAHEETAFMDGPRSQVDAVLEAGFGDLERALELSRLLSANSLSHDCMVFLAWHLHDIRGHSQRARALLDEALPHIDEDDVYYKTAMALDQMLKNSD